MEKLRDGKPDNNFWTAILWQKYAARLLLILVLLAMAVFLSLRSPFFLRPNNIKNILNQMSAYLTLSVGMSFVIVSGGIDLSVGSIIAASAVAAGAAMKAGLPVGAAILLGLLLGALIGAVSGLIISRVGINALIVTLSMMSIVRGSTILLTNGKPIFGFAKDFTWWGSAGDGLINPPIAISFGVLILGALALERTKLGRYTFAMGSNEDALRKTGVNICLYKICVYAISGLCAAITGFILAARLNTAEPLAGSGYEMDAIAAVVLGGTSIRGGSGSIGGTFIACLIFAVMRNGLNILSISSNYQQLLAGLIIMVAVGVSELRRGRAREI
ncbi:MAG: ABC transporter permease [Peptococcaceae bacterium]|jgi:ribose/xylose/arabinose/galactoside ABC-type transport system permease subunit|nr:ABC transporter permease [Peptococcaceae bacterium]